VLRAIARITGQGWQRQWRQSLRERATRYRAHYGTGLAEAMATIIEGACYALSRALRDRAGGDNGDDSGGGNGSDNGDQWRRQ